MLIIVMHNNLNYLKTLEKLCQHNGINHSVVLQKDNIAQKLIGDYESLLSAKGVFRPTYNKALVIMVDESQEKNFTEIILNDPSLINLNLDNEGFLCSLPINQVKLISLKQTKLLKTDNISLLSYVKSNHVVWNMKASSKEKAIKEIADTFTSREVTDASAFVKEVLEREALSSTGFGNGIGIPHARSNTLKDIIIGIGYSKEGIEFDSLDEEKVNYIFLIGTPNKKEFIEKYLKLVARFASFIRNERFKMKLSDLKSGEELLDILRESEIEISKLT